MNNYSLTYDDILLTPNYCGFESRRDVDIRFKDRDGKLSLDIPIISAPMDTISGSAMANYMHSKGAMAALHRFCSVDDGVLMFKRSPEKTFVSVGSSEDELIRVEALRDCGAAFWIVDTAMGHAKSTGRQIKRMRDMLGKDAMIMAGNVVTYAGSDYLVGCGADIVRVGIGGGGFCRTRIATGIGVPNLTAIKECSRIGKPCIMDGGIRCGGDFAKSMAFGAELIMVGSLLAGTEPTPGPVFEKEGKKYKRCRGMASREANIDSHGELGKYKTDEGISKDILYKDNIDEIIQELEGGLRSAMTYMGAQNIKEMQQKLQYVVVSNSGHTEGTPHVKI